MLVISSSHSLIVGIVLIVCGVVIVLLTIREKRTEFIVVGGRQYPQRKLYELQQKIIGKFSTEDIKQLCFKLGIDYDTLPGEEKTAKTRALIFDCTQKDSLEDLIETCRQERPNTKWESIAVSESSWGTAIEQVG